MVLLPAFAIQIFPGASIASDDGALMLPLPLNGDPLNTVPALVNAETVDPPLFAIHALPAESMATLAGPLSPLPLKENPRWAIRTAKTR